MLYIPDTIVALATPPGEGAIGIIRLSGPKAVKILHILCPDLPSEIVPHHLYLSSLRHPGSNEFLDEGLVVWMKSPQSFTGEDCVEFQLHGSPLNISRIIKSCTEQGARLAEPGEFSKRAYLNGKMDLSRAEAIADLIHAQTDRQARNALSQLSGYLFKIITEIRAQLTHCLALIEIGFDFSDQDLTLIEKDKIISSLENINRSIDNLIASYQTGQFLRRGIRVALIGKPNVGKSSLMNALLREEKSIIHPRAGTTRDVIEGQFLLQGIPIQLYDTAGIHETSDEIEQMGVQKSHEALQKADLVLFLLDGSRPLETADESLQSVMGEKPHLMVKTKSDLPAVWSSAPFSNSKALTVEVSVKSEQGLKNLTLQIEKIFFKSVQNYDTNYVLNNVRHHTSLLQSQELIQNLLASLKKNQIQEECVVEELRRISELLGEITGEVNTETVLDEIFSRFCIGK